MTDRPEILASSAVASVVHDVHIDALRVYGASTGFGIRRAGDGIGLLRDLLRHSRSGKTLFIQSTGPSNFLTLPVARLLGWRVIYYFHEPTSLHFKLNNKDNCLKAVIKQCVQFLDAKLSSVILISREQLRQNVVDLCRVKPDRIALAPLLLPEVSLSAVGNRNRITYLGRADRRRMLEEFVSLAGLFRVNGLQPTILTGDPKGLEAIVGTRTDAVDVHAVKGFSEGLKKQILEESCLIWNPKSTEIAQSGVTVDALRFGVTSVLNRYDPDYEALLSEGAAIDYDQFVDALKGGYFDAAALHDVNAAALGYFDRSHGQQAFEASYRHVLTGY
ncbi:hypothetical protein [uncultured Roseibium sp.]|uniref:hypothetical protein n=1 Tax=uncultured Roseibium sp. TaxID=1936171 RepID=UPI002593192C|nr:hypothetical protein [uncultured Roseibium sp.]